jgi:hypothetical protein
VDLPALGLYIQASEFPKGPRAVAAGDARPLTVEVRLAVPLSCPPGAYGRGHLMVRSPRLCRARLRFTATAGVAQLEPDGHHCTPQKMANLQGKRQQARTSPFWWRTVD